MIEFMGNREVGFCYVHYTLEDLDRYNSDISKLDGMPIKHHIHGDGSLLVVSLDGSCSNLTVMAVFAPLVESVRFLGTTYLGLINLTDLTF